ncbi:Unknown protein, partial [Striga hermonthica]
SLKNYITRFNERVQNMEPCHQETLLVSAYSGLRTNSMFKWTLCQNKPQTYHEFFMKAQEHIMAEENMSVPSFPALNEQIAKAKEISYEQLVQMINAKCQFEEGWTIQEITMMISQPDGSWNHAMLNNDSFEWIYYFPSMSMVYLHLSLQANTPVTQFEDFTPCYGGVFDVEGTSTSHVPNFGEGTSREWAADEDDEDFIPGEDDFTDETSETELDRSVNEKSEAEFIEEEHPFPIGGRHIYREMGEWDPSRIDANEYAIPRWNGDIETIRLGTVFQSKEEAQTGLMAWNVDRLREVRTKDSNQKSFKLVCKSNADVPCLWKARVNKYRRRDDLWEVTEWTDQHTCMQQVDRNDHRNVIAHMIANLIINKIQKKVEYNINMVQADVKQCWKVDVSYKKAWHGRKKGIECVYGSWESNFAELP